MCNSTILHRDAICLFCTIENVVSFFFNFSSNYLATAIQTTNAVFYLNEFDIILLFVFNGFYCYIKTFLTLNLLMFLMTSN